MWDPHSAQLRRNTAEKSYPMKATVPEMVLRCSLCGKLMRWGLDTPFCTFNTHEMLHALGNLNISTECI